jgi:hypothetical protein
MDVRCVILTAARKAVTGGRVIASGPEAISDAHSK